MPDELYDRDILAWSEYQAGLLRRVAAGERVNGIDWAHVAEEIEDVGLSQLNAVRSLLQQVLIRLLKLHGWPNLSACNHWRAEIVTFQGDLSDRFAPSMRQKIDLEAIYKRAVRVVGRLGYGNAPAPVPPGVCPVSPDDLLIMDPEALEALFRRA